MEGPSEADDADETTDTGADSEADGGRRVVEAGAGADVPLDDDAPEDADSDDGGDHEVVSEESPDRPDVASDGGGTEAADGDEEAVTFEDIVDEGDDSGAEARDGDLPGEEFEGGDSSDEESADESSDERAAVEATDEDAPTTADVAADQAEPDDETAVERDEDDETAVERDDADPSTDVPPELRQLLSERDDPDVEEIVREVTSDADIAADDSGAATTEPAGDDSARRKTSGDDYGAAERPPEGPTDLATTDSGGENLTPTEEGEEPAPETEPVSMRSEMSPALAERQAFLSLLLALGAGALFATIGNVLKLSRWQTIMVLVSAGIIVLLIATFVVFRAMLAAAERNDEPYKTAYTHPLFMFLFGVTTVVTALFIGYVSRLLT